MLGHFNKAGVPPKRIVKEFPVTPDAHVPVGEPSLSSPSDSKEIYFAGTTLSAIHFVPGQFVDVVANSYVFLVLQRKILKQQTVSEKAFRVE